MKKMFIVGLMLHGLFASSVQAETKHCHSIEDCQKLKAEVEADLAELLKNVAPKLTGILKTGVTQYEASEICASEGLRLPTAREFALIAQSLGAVGITEPDPNRPLRYTPIEALDSAGNTDFFHYGRDGYKPPPSDLGKKFFWSSSLKFDYESHAYAFDGNSAMLQYEFRTDKPDIVGVRCVLK